MCVLPENSNIDEEIIENLYQNLNIYEKSFLVIFHAVAAITYRKSEMIQNGTFYSIDTEKREINIFCFLKIL